LYIKWARLYILYQKVPWDLGYPFLEEIDALMPMIDKTIKKKRKSDTNTEAQTEWENIRSPKLGKNRSFGS
jgi:hypothetical protein